MKLLKSLVINMIVNNNELNVATPKYKVEYGFSTATSAIIGQSTYSVAVTSVMIERHIERFKKKMFASIISINRKKNAVSCRFTILKCAAFCKIMLHQCKQDFSTNAAIFQLNQTFVKLNYQPKVIDNTTIYSNNRFNIDCRPNFTHLSTIF